MFIQHELEWTVVVEPHEMKSTAHIQRALIRRLLKDFSSIPCREDHGYYVTVTTLEEIGEGRLWERRGCAAFPLRFQCVTFKPVKSERFLAVVFAVSAVGVFCGCGPMDSVESCIFVMARFLKGYVFDEKESNWCSTTTGLKICEGTVIRVKILGVKWEPAQQKFMCAGTIEGVHRVIDERWPEPLKAPEETFGNGHKGNAWGEETPEETTGGWGQDREGDTKKSTWDEQTPEETAGGWGDTKQDERQKSTWEEETPKETTGGWGETLETKSGWEEQVPEDAAGGWGGPAEPENGGASGWD